MRKECKNDKRPVIQSSGYNGSEPMRVCPHCRKEKPISEFGYRNMGVVKFEISLGVKNVDKFVCNNKALTLANWNSWGVKC